MLPAKALKLALARVAVTRFEGLLCRAVHSGTLYGFSGGKLYPPRPLYNLGPPKNGARFTPKGWLACVVPGRGLRDVST